MFIVVSPSDPDPIYRQIEKQIINAIASGELTEQTKLPSINEMTKDLGISSITVKRVYSDLETEGYIYTRMGIGSFIAPVDKQKLKREKVEEMKSRLWVMIKDSEQYGITKNDLLQLIKEMEDR
ncbi:MAG: GntR family transcriptional regulator [Bacillota bacterium]|nr:GntR family transcriptional regulator [Bacillota bacterium]